MRKTTIALLAIGLAAVLVTPASATKFWTETFSLPDQALGASPNGTLNTVTGWYTHSSASGYGGTANDVQIVGQMAIVNQANQPDDSRNFGVTTGATDKTYACFKLYVPAMSGMSTTATYFAHFKEAASTGTVFSAKVFATGISADNVHFNLGISNGATNTPVNWGTPLTFDTWYVIAMRYDAALGVATLWVNPASESSPSVSGTDTTPAGRLLAAFSLREAGQNWTCKIDDISTGTTFDETCSGQPTPTSSSTWGRIKTIYR